MNSINCYNKKIYPNRQYTIISWLYKVIGDNKDNIAIVDGDECISYETLQKKIEQYAKFFLRIGIRAKNNVVLQIPNSKEYAFSLFALVKIGAVPVITNSQFREKEIIGIIKKTAAVAYVYCGKFSEIPYRELATKVKKKYCNVILCSTDNIENEKDGICKSYNASVNETAILMMSGGTTGFPKIIPISHSMIFLHLFCYIKRFNLTSDDVYLAALPLTHKLGLYSPGFLNILFIGGKSVICRVGSCDEHFSIIENQKVTVTSIVPTIARIWIDFLEYDKSYDLSSIRLVSIGGSMIDSETISRFINKIHCNVGIIYGTTEGFSMYGMYNRNSKSIYNAYKYLISGYEDVKIIKDNGAIAKENECGELVIRGPYTIKNYYNLSDNLGDKFTHNGYYRTGDKACYDKEKGYQIIGRIVDQINRAGEKIDPNEIEECICHHPYVKEAIAVGVEDYFLGEKNCLFIIPKNKSITLQEVRVFLKKRGLAYYKIPDKLVLIESWPLTQVNKIDKIKLRKIAKKSDYAKEA
ncbi:AMP-binding protein [Clostridium niameyense]|uniref:AMP-binding protein n=1 Tax=Clostridium niameyense TaxID=1622073 RepID=UPI00067ED1D3|nr:AMP-binding protein [Clostridium niameyense]